MKIQKSLLLFTILLCTTFFSFAQKRTTKTLDVNEYETSLTATKNMQLIDVRTPEEYSSGHLTDAQNVNYYDTDFRDQLNLLDKSKPTFIYCKSGSRSASAMETMEELGFKEIYNLKGGIMAWQASSKALEGEANMDMSMQTRGISEAKFKDMIVANVPVIVDFSAKWCGPCKILKPRLQELEQRFGDEIKIIYIDVDENKTLADAMNIRSIPALYFYKNGKLHSSFIGLMSKKALLKKIKTLK
ncbi:MAG: thioredoxin fold domain-containing protein [Chitinophagaceae bacterium]|nr:thioredoxin fold domain-containing protein [Chitinophagaceae bacterium]